MLQPIQQQQQQQQLQQQQQPNALPDTTAKCFNLSSQKTCTTKNLERKTLAAFWQ